MKREQIAHFKSVYRAMSEWDIEELDSRKNGLTEEAQAALSEIIAERQVNIAAMREEVAHEADVANAKMEAKEKLDRVQEEKITKRMLLFVVPLCAVIFLIRPERSYETVVSSIVQGLLLVGLAWGVRALFKWTKR